MAYTKQTWEDAPSTDTPISAARLGVMEEGIETAHELAEAAQADADAAQSTANSAGSVATAAASAAVTAQTTANNAATAAATAQTTANAKAAKTDVQITVAHGTDPNVARPSGYASVRWVGTATPANKVDGDDWVNPDAPLVATVEDTDALDTRLTDVESLSATNAAGLTAQLASIETIEDLLSGVQIYYPGDAIPETPPARSIFFEDAEVTPDAPATPSGFNLTPGVGTLAGAWTALTGGTFTSYEYRVRNNNTGIWSSWVSTGTTASFSAISAPAGVSHTVEVRAVNSGVYSPSVATDTDTPTGSADTTPPSLPTGLAATPGPASMTLSWTDPADSDLDVIKIWMAPTGETLVHVDTVAAGTESWFQEALTIEEFDFALSAVDQTGNETATKTSIVSETPDEEGGGGPDPYALTYAATTPLFDYVAADLGLADEALVSTWEGRQGPDLVGSGTARPSYLTSVAALGSKPAVDYRGDDILQGALASVHEGPFTLFIVSVIDSHTTTGVTVGTSNATTPLSFHLEANSNGNYRVSGNSAAGTAVVKNFPVPAITDGVRYVRCVRCDGTNMKVREVADAGWGTGENGIPTAYVSYVRTGARRQDGSNYFDGKIARITGYGSSLSDSDCVSILGELSTMFGG